MSKIYDFRSDTVTHPTPAMREAMYRAEVGDDSYGEDPTVNRLEQMAAERMGKEAAVFVASGTMANLVSVLSHCQRGDEVILGDEAHIFMHEVGGAATFGGLQMRTLPNVDGSIEPALIEAAIRQPGLHFPRTGLICLENTHNRCGGSVITGDYIAKVCDVAHRHNLPIHLDGARIFNAAVYLGVPPKDLVAPVDSVTFCLSKGLCCPVGSLICGSADFVQVARKNRKRVGGGMRQAGIIAAAGIVALEQMVERLAEDHVNARKLAWGLANIPGLQLDPGKVQTNIVVFDLTSARLSPQHLMIELAAEGLRISHLGGRRMRMVTHHGLEAEDVPAALGILARVLAS